MKSQLFGPAAWSSVSAGPRAAACFLSALAAMTVAPSLEAQEEGNDTVVAIIKAPPAKQLTEKIMAVARRVQPGPQTEALPFILGGMLGDPMLEGFAASENLGIALVTKGEEVIPVLVLNLSEESPLRESLPNLEMRLHDVGGWTFATAGDAPVNLDDESAQAIIAAVRTPRRYDFELTADAGMLGGKLREAFAEAVAPGLDEAFRHLIAPLVATLAGEAASIEDFRAGLNVSPERIEQIWYVSAARSSGLHSLLTQRRANDFDFARFIPADGALAYLGGVDPKALQNYADHLISRLVKEGGGEVEKWAEAFREMSALYLEGTNGASGGILTIDGMEVRMIQVSPSSMSDEQLVDMLQRTVTQMGRILGETSGDEPQLVPQYELIVDAFQVDGIPIHIFRNEVKLDPEHAKELEEQMPGFTLPVQRQDLHYALVDGLLVSASDASTVSSIIDSVRKGTRVESSIADLISVGPDDLFEFRIDLLRYIGGTMAPYMTPEMAVVMERLEQRGIQPVRATISAREGEGEFKLHIPVDALVAVFQTVSGFMAAQEQEAELEDDPFAVPAKP